MKCLVQSLLYLAFVGALTACSRAHPPEIQYKPDRLVVTNRYRAAVSITVTGAEAARIADAVGSSTEDHDAYPDVKDCQIQFYYGTNLVRVIYVQDRLFQLGATQYSDPSGVLAAFYAKWQTNSFRRGE